MATWEPCRQRDSERAASIYPIYIIISCYDCAPECSPSVAESVAESVAVMSPMTRKFVLRDDDRIGNIRDGNPRARAVLVISGRACIQWGGRASLYACTQRRSLHSDPRVT